MVGDGMDQRRPGPDRSERRRGDGAVARSGEPAMKAHHGLESSGASWACQKWCRRPTNNVGGIRKADVPGEGAMSRARPKKAYRGLAMEGLIARWYARNTGRNIEGFKRAAQEIAQRVPSGSDVLEVAPGP